MQLLEQTLPTCAAHLALDAWLLEHADRGAAERRILRIWEWHEHAIVLGRGSYRAREVDVSVAAGDGVPILRRCSGGSTVVLGPGCLVYSLVLPRTSSPRPHSIADIHRWVLERIVVGFQALNIRVQQAGISDLAFVDRGTIFKCGGNSLRVGRGHFLYHGTVLYDFDLQRVSRWLRHPPREPDYRQGRSHADFLANLPQDRETVRRALLAAWKPVGHCSDVDPDQLQNLIDERYANLAWTCLR